MKSGCSIKKQKQPCRSAVVMKIHSYSYMACPCSYQIELWIVCEIHRLLLSQSLSCWPIKHSMWKRIQFGWETPSGMDCNGEMAVVDRTDANIMMCSACSSNRLLDWNTNPNWSIQCRVSNFHFFWMTVMGRLCPNIWNWTEQCGISPFPWSQSLFFFSPIQVYGFYFTLTTF